MLSGEAITTSLWFDQTGLEPLIFCSRNKHANHYATDVVSVILDETTLVTKCSLAFKVSMITLLLFIKGASIATIMWYLDLHLPIQPIYITTNVAILNYIMSAYGV